MIWKTAGASEYLAITGWGITDILLAKKSWVFPGQRLAKLMSKHDKRSKHVDEHVQGVIEGETRVLAASMTMEQIFKGTKEFKKEVFEKVQLELNQFGLLIYNANVKQLVVDVPGHEYFSYLGQKTQMEAANQAKIDVAEAKKKGEIGAKERQGLTAQNAAKIDAETKIITTQRLGDAQKEEINVKTSVELYKNQKEAELVKSKAELATKNAGWSQASQLAEVESAKAVAIREAELQTEVEKKKALNQTEKLRAELPSKAAVEYETKVQEANWDLYKKQKAAEAVLYEAQKAAEAQKVSADANFYASQQAAESKLYAKKKEAEGITALAQAEGFYLNTLLKQLGQNHVNLFYTNIKHPIERLFELFSVTPQFPKSLAHSSSTSNSFMALITSSSSSSSSSFSTPEWKYDVFISFRGKDTRTTFTDHLYAALELKDISTFRDEKLEQGKRIHPELHKAIEQSRIAVVIFSSNYASSSWCLTELAKIVACMKSTGLVVLPVFHYVDPSDVQNQKGIYAEAFKKHEEPSKDIKKEDVYMWKAAMKEVGSISGWDLRNRHESKVIQEIVGRISSELNGLQQFMVDLRTMKKHKVFLDLKRDLAMAVQATFRAEELVNISHRQMKDEEGRQVAAVEAFNVAEKRVKELNTKLIEAEREKKSAEVALERVERQAETQHKQLRQAEDELAAAREQIKVLKKKLEDAEKAKD